MVREKGPSFGLQLHKNKFIVYATYLSLILFFSIENISCAASTLYVAHWCVYAKSNAIISKRHGSNGVYAFFNSENMFRTG